MYVAFTSNTFQLGSSVEAGLHLGPLSAHGWFKFDALIQFEPFYFQADIDAGFEIEVGDVSIASARVQGQLSGPGPITIQAHASVKVLFVRVSGRVTLRLGPGGGDTEQRLPSAYPMMLAELNAKNLRGEGDDPDVFLRRDRPLLAAAAQSGITVPTFRSMRAISSPSVRLRRWRRPKRLTMRCSRRCHPGCEPTQAWPRSHTPNCRTSGPSSRSFPTTASSHSPPSRVISCRRRCLPWRRNGAWSRRSTAGRAK
jgi:hypothetical protein